MYLWKNDRSTGFSSWEPGGSVVPLEAPSSFFFSGATLGKKYDLPPGSRILNPRIRGSRIQNPKEFLIFESWNHFKAQPCHSCRRSSGPSCRAGKKAGCRWFGKLALQGGKVGKVGFGKLALQGWSWLQTEVMGGWPDPWEGSMEGRRERSLERKLSHFSYSLLMESIETNWFLYRNQSSSYKIIPLTNRACIAWQIFLNSMKIWGPCACRRRRYCVHFVKRLKCRDTTLTPIHLTILISPPFIWITLYMDIITFSTYYIVLSKYLLMFFTRHHTCIYSIDYFRNSSQNWLTDECKSELYCWQQCLTFLTWKQWCCTRYPSYGDYRIFSWKILWSTVPVVDNQTVGSVQRTQS